jgi:phospholipid/cholesterol/gamma-HCH transport system permease protein
LSRLPKLDLVDEPGQPRLLVSGPWTSAHYAEMETAVAAAEAALPGHAAASLRLEGLEALDSYGAWLIERFVRDSARRGIVLQSSGLPGPYQDMAAQIAATNQTPSPTAVPVNRVVAAVEATGRAVAGLAEDFAGFAAMLGAIIAAAATTIAHPSRFRLTSAVHQLDRVGFQAVPIISLITLLIGGIIAQQGFFHFRRFGAEIYAVDMTGILVLREIGVLIVAIMVAGRSGSSYTAELGSMKMREEIDALGTMGLDPIEVLILPRIAALLIALPMLAFLGAMMALLGGGLMAWAYGGMSPDAFIERLKEAISLTHFKVGMIKSPFMALAIGVVAASEGFKVAGSAESLGLRTTASVVKSIFLVIVLDGAFAAFFASIGM